MFKWIISILLILISLPIIYFNITSFYQAKKEFQTVQQHTSQIQKTEQIQAVDNNKTINFNSKKQIQSVKMDEFGRFEQDFEKEWKSF